jgi:hypothetical protein
LPTRRDLLKAALLSALVKPVAALLQLPASNAVTEQQKGDPDLPYEQVTFDPEAIRRLAVHPGKASFEKWDAHLPTAMITTARDFLGFSRASNPDQITEFLALFGLPFRDKNGYLAFCAAGISFCALMAYANVVKPGYDKKRRLDQFRKLGPDLEHYYFYPTVSCVDMYHIAAGKRRWVDHKTSPTTVPSPGWIVLYDWNHRGSPDHCGIVQHATKNKLFTVEFNTVPDAGNQRNGGTVAERTRDYDFVSGFVVTDSRPDPT